MLSERQELILGIAVEAYLKTGTPVGSKAIAERADFDWGPSTVRAELSALEREGYLTQPHTSAGRIPTDAGYRRYADDLIEAGARPAPSAAVPIDRLCCRPAARSRTRCARRPRRSPRPTTCWRSPRRRRSARATIHRVEVLRLQPRVVAVVAIADNGDVAKRVFTFESPVDSGLVEWASSFLNERLTGLGIGSSMVSARLQDPEVGDRERAFLERDRHRRRRARRGDAAAALHGRDRPAALREPRLRHPAPRRRRQRARGPGQRPLACCGAALRERSVFLCIGDENPEPALRSMSVVGAGYGLGYRNLGAVGVVGPLRMDYAKAIDSVRDAAGELSRLFATVYEG